MKCNRAGISHRSSLGVYLSHIPSTSRMSASPTFLLVGASLQRRDLREPHNPKDRQMSMPVLDSGVHCERRHQSRRVSAMELGAFSISLAVKDLEASRRFYEAFGFQVFGGDATQNWL